MIFQIFFTMTGEKWGSPNTLGDASSIARTFAKWNRPCHVVNMTNGRIEYIAKAYNEKLSV